MTYDPDPDIELTWREVWEGSQEGLRRYLMARKENRPTGNGRWDAQKSTVDFDVTGALAERAFAKHLGEPWAPLDRPDRYHPAHDVAGWQVRGTRLSVEKQPHLCQPLSADPEAAYVLLSGWMQHWTIVGWGLGMELFQDRWITRLAPDQPDVYWIPPHGLALWPPDPRRVLRMSGLHP
jgi:hypothetical protein